MNMITVLDLYKELISHSQKNSVEFYEKNLHYLFFETITDDLRALISDKIGLNYDESVLFATDGKSKHDFEQGIIITDSRLFFIDDKVVYNWSDIVEIKRSKPRFNGSVIISIRELNNTTKEIEQLCHNCYIFADFVDVFLSKLAVEINKLNTYNQ